MVGPGVRHLGDDETWADHTDTRPTMLTLVGLQDTYDHDGRVLIDQLNAWAVPQTLRAHRATLRQLGEVYKQLNAPFGQFGMDTLAISTQALQSGSSSDDSTYTALENQLSSSVPWQIENEWQDDGDGDQEDHNPLEHLQTPIGRLVGDFVVDAFQDV
jgi:hypothetical protein